MKKDIRIILHNIRSSHNVGSILRTADGAGVDMVYMTGYTPSPKDKYGRADKKLIKTSLGSENMIKWQKKENIGKLIIELKKEGFKIYAIEQDKSSIDYKKIKINKKSIFIFGNEVKGLSKSVLEKADKILEIPMRGKKESLNVSVSAGIILFNI